MYETWIWLVLLFQSNAAHVFHRFFFTRHYNHEINRKQASTSQLSSLHPSSQVTLNEWPQNQDAELCVSLRCGISSGTCLMPAVIVPMVLECYLPGCCIPAFGQHLCKRCFATVQPGHSLFRRVLGESKILVATFTIKSSGLCCLDRGQTSLLFPGGIFYFQIRK